MAGRLDQLTILVPESRELDLFAGMLEAEGAATLRCPLVQIQDVEDHAAMDEWLEQLAQNAFDDLILMTGEGLRRLIGRSESIGRREACVAALSRLRIIVRGPKPGRALRELGLASGLAAQAPTSQGVLDTLADSDLRGRRIGVQLYPAVESEGLVSALRARGAIVFPVTPYRYVSQAETRQVAEMILKMAEGEIGVIAFTSSPQIRRLSEVASEHRLERELAKGFARTRVAAIGPLVEEALKKLGVSDIIRPETAFHLKPLVGAIIAACGAAEAMR